MFARTPLLTARLIAAFATAALLPTSESRASPAIERPIGADVLGWDQARRDAGFGHMEQHYRMAPVRHGGHVFALPPGAPLKLDITTAAGAMTLAQFMTAQHSAGLLVLQNGRVRLEVYGDHADAATRWTSFSIAKSVTSTLIGAAVARGQIRSIDDPVTAYVPELRGSGYDGVSIREVLEMRSGVAWNEDYADPESDVARLFREPGDATHEPTIAYLARLHRAHDPGSIWHYNTGETGLAGVVLARATHTSLPDLLSAAIWRPFGMEADAAWGVGPAGQSPGGCCLSATLRDYGRFGLFMLAGGHVKGRAVLPTGWIAAATHAHSDTGTPGRGYGFQWWTGPADTYEAIGIFGQAIHIDPARRLVVVMLSAWPSAVGPDLIAQRAAFFASVTRAVDADRAR